MFAPDGLRLTQSSSARVFVEGPIIAALGIIACSEVTRGLRFFLLVFGLLMIVAPFVFGEWQVETGGAVNEIICGGLLAILSLFRGTIKNRHGGGWTAIWNLRKQSDPE
jgi:hypothetical protein